MAIESPKAQVTPRLTKARLGFRTQLAVLIGVAILVSGLTLLLVQFVVLTSLFDREVTAVSVGAAGSDPRQGSPDAPTGCPSIGAPSAVVSPAPGESTGCVPTEAGDDAGIANTLRANVLGGSLVWFGVLVIPLTAVSAGVAWWLSGRALGRVRDVTALAADVSARDLSSRLNLPGPADEIKDLGDTFDRMLDRLEESFLARERFVANASHELRTPVAAARVALEAPLTQGRFPHDVEPSVRRALAATQTSASLITALLELAQPDTLPPQHSDNLDVADVVRASLDVVRCDVAGKDISVHLSLDRCPVRAQPSLIRIVVDNLVGNAVRHTPAGGDVWFRVQSRGGRAVMTVANSGPELKQSEVTQYVEPFHRGSWSRHSGQDGHGLGLSIVASIVARQSGVLSLHARPGGGLSVEVDWPVG